MPLKIDQRSGELHAPVPTVALSVKVEPAPNPRSKEQAKIPARNNSASGREIPRPAHLITTPRLFRYLRGRNNWVWGGPGAAKACCRISEAAVMAAIREVDG
jgi:hypothetical protein